MISIFLGWRPLDNAMSSNFLFPKSWVSELSFELSFLSVLEIVLSQFANTFWKTLEEIFRIHVISAIFSKWQNLQKIFPPVFFNILEDPLLLQKQMIAQRHASSPSKAYFVEFYGHADGVWLLAFNEISRRPLLSLYTRSKLSVI